MGRDREEMALKMIIACMTLAVAIYAVDTSVHDLDSIESGFGWWDFIMMGGQGYSTFDYMMEERDLGESQGSAKVLDRPVRFAPELLKKVKDLQIQDGIVTSPNSSAFCVPDLSSLLVETEKELEEKLLVETKEGSFKEFAENFPMLRRHICDNFDKGSRPPCCGTCKNRRVCKPKPLQPCCGSNAKISCERNSAGGGQEDNNALSYNSTLCTCKLDPVCLRKPPPCCKLFTKNTCTVSLCWNGFGNSSITDSSVGLELGENHRSMGRKGKPTKHQSSKEKKVKEVTKGTNKGKKKLKKKKGKKEKKQRMMDSGIPGETEQKRVFIVDPDTQIEYKIETKGKFKYYTRKVVACLGTPEAEGLVCQTTRDCVGFPMKPQYVTKLCKRSQRLASEPCPAANNPNRRKWGKFEESANKNLIDRLDNALLKRMQELTTMLCAAA